MASEKNQIVFVVIVALLILIGYLFLQYQEMLMENILWIIIIAGLIVIVTKTDVLLQLKEYERAVVFRLGKLNRVGGPGWILLIPFLEEYSKVDLRIQTFDTPKQEVITKDGIEVKIDALFYLKVKEDADSVVRSVIKIDDYKNAARLYLIALLRDTCGNFTLSQLIESRSEINDVLKKGLKELAEAWGVTCVAVEIKDIDIPQTVIEAMHDEKAAVQRKLARMEEAMAHKAEIDAVKQAAEQLSDKALSYYYIRALEKMSEGKATKIVFPMEISKLAQTISGKLGKGEGVDAENLLKQYGPLIAKYMVKEKKKREKEEDQEEVKDQ